MALQSWMFLYSAPGLPAEGRVTVVETPACTTVLAGFPSTDAAMAACRGELTERLRDAQLIELCGAFAASHVAELRALAPDVPIGLVTYTGDMVGGLHRLFG